MESWPGSTVKKNHLSQKDNSISSCVLRKAPSIHKCPFKEKLSLLEALISQENITHIFALRWKDEIRRSSQL